MRETFHGNNYVWQWCQQRTVLLHSRAVDTVDSLRTMHA